jgi:hypothetical protein
MYYIINTDYSNSNYACFWAEEGRGYTMDITKAGRFGANYCLARKHNEALLFLPVGAVKPDMTETVLANSYMVNLAISGDALPDEETAAS